MRVAPVAFALLLLAASLASAETVVVRTYHAGDPRLTGEACEGLDRQFSIHPWSAAYGAADPDGRFDCGRVVQPVHGGVASVGVSVHDATGRPVAFSVCTSAGACADGCADGPEVSVPMAGPGYVVVDLSPQHALAGCSPALQDAAILATAGTVTFRLS